MENDQLTAYFDLKGKKVVPVECTIEEISEVGDTDAVDGIDSQKYVSVVMTPKSNDDVIDSSGNRISKTFFERTHPKAFTLITEKWKGLDPTILASKIVKGNIFIVPTKRNFVRMRRDRDKESPNFGELVPMIDSRTKQPVIGNQMSFFLLNDESELGELRRRGTQLEKKGYWKEPATSSNVGSLEDTI